MTHRLALLLSDLEESFFFAAVLEGGGVVPVVAFDTESVVLEREDPRVVDELMMSFRRSKEKKTRSQGAKVDFFLFTNCCTSCLLCAAFEIFFLELFQICVTDKFEVFPWLLLHSHSDPQSYKNPTYYTKTPI